MNAKSPSTLIARWEALETASGTDATYEIRRMDGLYIADAGCWTDARLIAAAPELLEALDELLHHVEWRRRAAGEQAGPNDCTHRARAAIAKATQV